MAELLPHYILGASANLIAVLIGHDLVTGCPVFEARSLAKARATARAASSSGKSMGKSIALRYSQGGSATELSAIGASG